MLEDYLPVAEPKAAEAKPFTYVALVTHNTGHGPLTEIYGTSPDLALLRKKVGEIGQFGFTFGTIDTGIRIYRVEKDVFYGKYGNNASEHWKHVNVLGGLNRSDRGFGQLHPHDPAWFLWDRYALPPEGKEQEWEDH
jgi:hypothetical protein